MVRRLVVSSVAAIILVCGAWASAETLEFGRFGTVSLYHESPVPAHVVLFVSGDGGWNLGVVDMAKALAGLDALVVGIDITHYLKQLNAGSEECGYPAGDLEGLSQYVQKSLNFPRYLPPVLVGYSSGATLVYAALVQAPTATFRGAISMGFCPDLPLTRPLCRGRGLSSTAGPKAKGVRFLPDPTLEAPWIAFQGLIDQVCDPAAVEAYVRQVGHAEIVNLPHVGHGFSVQRNWLPQFKASFARLTAAAPAPPPSPVPGDGDVSDLPLVEIPATGPTTDLMAVIVSGDGGWASLDKQVGAALAAHGIPVVGVNSLQYFWKAREPDGIGRDMTRILDYATAAWGERRIVLVGYSLGADVLPFMTSRLPDTLRSRIALVTLIGPGTRASFEFHLSEWLGGRPDPKALPILTEVEKLRGLPVLCISGEKEVNSLCANLGEAAQWVQVMRLGGGHHLGGDYDRVAEAILARVVPASGGGA